MKTILVIDDEFGMAEALSSTLVDEGYRVFIASNGKQGFTMLAETKPDIVILDYMMPVMNGAEMLTAMRRDTAYQNIPVIMISAVEEETLRAHATGYQAFLRKPFSLEALLETIQHV